jgi:hypothetical protein
MHALVASKPVVHGRTPQCDSSRLRRAIRAVPRAATASFVTPQRPLAMRAAGPRATGAAGPGCGGAPGKLERDATSHSGAGRQRTLRRNPRDAACHASCRGLPSLA